MDTVLLEEKNISEYVYDTIYKVMTNGDEIHNAKFHHNTAYKDVVSICKYGILTLNDLNFKGIRKDSDEFLEVMDDNESHVNGNNCVSLAIVGLTDIYPNEDEYNPFSPNLVDFLISSDIKASRSAIHYGNEFLSHSSISVENIKSIDIRLLKLLGQVQSHTSDCSLKTVLQNYNYLREIALFLKRQQLVLPIREMSESSIFELNVIELANKPKLLLKKTKNNI